MPGQNRYLITALPALVDLGDAPPLTPVELLEHLSDSPSLTILLSTLFLSDDLLQRQACLAGEITQLQLAVLTENQARDEQPLPPYLAQPETEHSRALAADRLWAAYYYYADRVARNQASRLLTLWVAYEVALRNALAEARAKALDIDPQKYLVTPQLACTDEDFTVLLNDWAAAPTPLAGTRVLDQARWFWLAQHDAWFTFGNDELVAYGARLLLLARWDRLTRADANENNS